MNFLFNSIVWILAIYGLLEIIKTIVGIFTYSKFSKNGMYLIIATKNQENCIESFMRSFLFRLLYGKDEYIKDIIVIDLNSSDSTYEIEQKLADDYEQIKLMEWGECKALLDKVNIQI